MQPFRTVITHTLNEETEDPKNSQLSVNGRKADTSGSRNMRLRSQGTRRIFDRLKIRVIRCSVDTEPR